MLNQSIKTYSYAKWRFWIWWRPLIRHDPLHVLFYSRVPNSVMWHKPTWPQSRDVVYIYMTAIAYTIVSVPNRYYDRFRDRLCRRKPLVMILRRPSTWERRFLSVDYICSLSWLMRLVTPFPPVFRWVGLILITISHSTLKSFDHLTTTLVFLALSMPI